MKGDANGAPKAKKSKGDSESSDEGDSSDDEEEEEEEKMEVEKPAAAAEATNGKAANGKAANGKKEESSSEEDSSDEEEEEKPKQNGKGQFFSFTYLHTLTRLLWTVKKTKFKYIFSKKTSSKINQKNSRVYQLKLGNSRNTQKLTVLSTPVDIDRQKKV